MPNPPSNAVLLCFDGVLHVSDLPVQAFARHIAEQLSADQARPVIAGMRGFLEGKTELMPKDVDLSEAEDGYQAVEILARAAGLDDPAISTARRASREDLAANAWLVDPAAGLAAILNETSGSARVVLLTEPGDPAARPVLAAIDIEVDDIVDSAIDLAVGRILHQVGTTPDRLLAIGTRWTDHLEHADRAGCRTAVVHRFGPPRGTPTYRSPDLAGLLDAVHEFTTTRTAT